MAFKFHFRSQLLLTIPTGKGTWKPVWRAASNHCQHCGEWPSRQTKDKTKSPWHDLQQVFTAKMTSCPTWPQTVFKICPLISGKDEESLMALARQLADKFAEAHVFGRRFSTISGRLAEIWTVFFSKISGWRELGFRGWFHLISKQRVPISSLMYLLSICEMFLSYFALANFQLSSHQTDAN